MNGWKIVLRIAETRKESHGVFKPELDAVLLKAIEIINGIVITHKNIIFYIKRRESKKKEMRGMASRPASAAIWETGVEGGNDYLRLCFGIITIMKAIGIKRYSLKPKGKNIEIALELLELSLILKKSVKKAANKK